jgi:hypothetical protein
MNSPGLIAPLLFLAPADATTNRGGPGKAFSDFVPPLLLGCRPDFVFATISTTKGPIDVESSHNKVRGTVAIVGGQAFLVYRHRQERPQALLLFRFRAQTLGLARVARGFYFRASLLTTFHRSIVSWKSRPAWDWNLFRFALRTINGHFLGIIAASQRKFAFAGSDLSNRLAQFIFALDFLSGDRQNHVSRL